MTSNCSSILVLWPSGQEVQTNCGQDLHHVRDLKASIAESLQIPRLCVELADGGKLLRDEEKLPVVASSPCIVTLTISAQQAHNRLHAKGTSMQEAIEAVEALQYTACADDDDTTFQALRSYFDFALPRQDNLKLRSATLGALADLASCGHVDAGIFIDLSLSSLSEALKHGQGGAVDAFCAYAPWGWRDPRLAKNAYEAFVAEKDVPVRHAAVRLVAKVVTKGDDETIALLQSRLECQMEDRLVRRMAAGALCRVAMQGHISAAAAIRSCERDGDAAIRSAALKLNHGQWQRR